MIVEMILVCLLAKLRRYKLRYLFNTWSFYPVLLTQCVLVVFQFSLFFGTYYFLPLVPVAEPMIILSFLFPIFAFALYKPAVFGAVGVGLGTVLNRFVIAQNGGKMPVYPSLSYLTGYVTPGSFAQIDQLHVLGNAATKFKFLTDYIDYGYCILSPGDVLIHLYACIMLYALIRAVNLRHQSNLKV